MLVRPLRVFGVAATVSAIAALGGAPSSADAAGYPSPTVWRNAPAVAALFPTAAGTGAHTCTAAVIRSATHDTLITAAHCVTGSGTGMSVVPGYRYGKAPYGVWRVTAVYANRLWVGSRHPGEDIAVLKVARKRINGALKGIQDVTGGYSLHASPRVGSTVVLGGYNGGSGDAPIRCVAPVRSVRGYPTVYCNGFLGGTSGSPFLQTIGSTTYVTGVLGGLHQGGCTPWTSHSSPFVTTPFALRARAEAGSRADVLPAPGPDGC